MQWTKAGFKLFAAQLFSAFLFSSVFNLSAQERIYELDASGGNGSNGEHGRDALRHRPLSSGEDGQHGGNATRASSGQHAGDIQLLLEQSERDARQGLITISGEYAEPGTGFRTPIRKQKVPVGDRGVIYLAARGGHGGKAVQELQSLKSAIDTKSRFLKMRSNQKILS